MDFKLFIAVVKRYKRIVIGGTILAVVLSVLSYGMPGLKGGKPTVIPRGSEVFQGQAELLISQAGFPYGRAVDQYTPGSQTSPSEPIGDENYMANLSSVYAAVANSTSIQQKVAKESGIAVCPSLQPCATVVAAEVDDISDGVPLPLITVTSSAPTAAAAVKLAATTVSVLESDITQQEASSGTPVSQRIQLQVLKNGSPATLTKGYSKSVPILVLFAVIAASIALAFMLNNHSDDPVRSTRRRLDDGLVPDGGLAFAGHGKGNGNGNGNGSVAEPEYGWAPSSGGKVQMVGHRDPDAGTRIAEENGAPQRGTTHESPLTGRRPVWVDRTQPHLLRRSGFEPESHD